MTKPTSQISQPISDLIQFFNHVEEEEKEVPKGLVESFLQLERVRYDEITQLVTLKGKISAENDLGENQAKLLGKIEELVKAYFTPEGGISRRQTMIHQWVRQILDLIPQNEQATALTDIVLLVSGVPFDFEVILQEIKEMPEGQRADVIAMAAPLCKGIRDGREIAAILRAITKIPEGQRADVIAKATLLCQSIPNGIEIAAILGEVKDIPAGQRADVIAKATPLCTDNKDGSQRAAILRAVKDIPEGQRADVIAKATPLCQGIPNGIEIAAILRAVMDIPAGQRADVIGRAAVILDLIPQNKQATALTNIVLLVPGEFIHFEFILQTIKEMPEGQRADVIARAMPLCKGLSDEIAISFILKMVNAIPEGQRADVIARAAPLCQSKTGGERLEILARSKKISKGRKRT